MLQALFSGNTKMSDALLANGRLLYVLPYFDIELGFGEKTIGQICVERDISTPLFLIICNIYTFKGYVPGRDEVKLIPIDELIRFLRNNHKEYTETRIPDIIAGVQSIVQKDSLIDGNVVDAFCKRYCQKILVHIRYENEVLFPYIARRIRNDNSSPKIRECEVPHREIAAALSDLKNFTIKFLPYSRKVEECRPVLLKLFDFDYELRKHGMLEEMVLMPLWAYLEKGRHSIPEGIDFSEREMETLVGIVRGLSNKQIAEKYHISPHTVITHRRSIIRKTGIKTPQGLVFYAIHNGLVSKNDF